MANHENSVQNPGGPGLGPVAAPGHPGPNGATHVAAVAIGPPPTGPINPAALTVEQLARLLTVAGGRAVAEATIRQHIDAGAPSLADGRLNLVHYVAWLLREVAIGEE